MTRKVSIIIVNWNGRRYLEDCLSSVFNQTYPNYEVILVDNGSNDGSVEFVKNSFPKVKILSLDKNYGFARGNNIGFYRSNGEYILLLNNDAYLQRDTLKIMVDEIEQTKDAGIIQPKILLTGNRGLDACGVFLTNTGFAYSYGLYEDPGDSRYNKKIPVFSANGACMLIKREVIERVGLFDEDFFAFSEEGDFCHRAWLAGYKTYYTPKATVYHIKGGTTAKEGEEVPPWLQFHHYKNRICSYLKNLGTKELLKIIPPHLLLVLSLSVLYLTRRRTELSKSLLRAVWWNVVNLNKTLRKRREVQRKIRTVSDEEIMKQIKRNPPLAYYRARLSNSVRI